MLSVDSTYTLAQMRISDLRRECGRGILPQKSAARRVVIPRVWWAAWRGLAAWVAPAAKGARTRLTARPH